MAAVDQDQEAATGSNDDKVSEMDREKPVEEVPPTGDAWWKDTKIWINLVGYIAVTLALIVIKVRPDLMPANERGYNCNDPTLKYPTKQDSVHQQTLIISTVSILLISVFISEGVYSVTPDYHSQRSLEALGEVPLKDKIFLFINLVTSKLLYGYLGLILTMNLTYHLQHMTSSFRPDFLGVCDPKPKHCEHNQIGYFIHCQQPNRALLADSRMSFPSEYATISFYMVFFSSLIIERAISGDFFALKLAVQSSYLFWAIYVTCSRIKDNKNHPIDSMCGCFIGILMAFLTDYLATYSDYMDGANYYDPSNITLNIQDWEDTEAQGEENPDAQHPQEF
ncbi:hypothetical protein EGW08_007585 [Elysia chlorotica]|uniref:Phosphatidic acid phosphatase type 2/haloperoxidase domain-containing protein n=1 Tax=Elysia chlorotica TaxID=188477 RepID=A0A433TSX0_ELYCH|nr:hypothetical protein EGW08_007585 [Elysia chlorotica]